MTTLAEAYRIDQDESDAEALPSGVSVGHSVECTDTLFSFSGHAGGVAVAPDGSIWVSDTLSDTIWHVTDDRAATPLVAIPLLSEDPRRSTRRLLAPAGLAFAPDGSLYVADSSGHRICAISTDGSLRVVAGGKNGCRDGPGAEAMFRFPLDVAFSPDGTCFVADSGNDRIRAISPDGVVSTIAGSSYDFGDGQGAQARFRRPAALDIDAEGTCFVADTGNNAVRCVSPTGDVATIAGLPPGGERDGSGRDVGLRWPTGIAVASDGSSWVADHGHGAVRHLSPDGKSTTALRLSGLLWPTVAALCANDRVVVAGAALYDVHVPQACLILL